jgi:hypothetical protein
MKIGPNDRCPCNSGKKLKKCCIVVARKVNINTPAKQIAKQVVKRWRDTVGNCNGLIEDLKIGQERIREFEENKAQKPLDNLPVEGEPLKIIRGCDMKSRSETPNLNIGNMGNKSKNGMAALMVGMALATCRQ